MASNGPKISVPIDDSINAKIQERVNLLKQARKEVRELEREAEKAIRTTGKASDEMLRKIDAAKQRAGGLNNEVRGLRSMQRPATFSGGSSRTSLGQLKDKLEAFEFRKNFSRGLKGELFGGGNGLGTAARAGAVGLAVYAGLRGGLATYDRDVQAERMGADIGTAKAFGQDTTIQEMELERKNLGNNGLSKFARGFADALPLVGGPMGKILDIVDEARAVSKGVSTYDVAAAKSNEATKGMSAGQRRQFLENARQDADGNAITTAVLDKIEQRLPDMFKKLLFGDRKAAETAQAAQKMARAKAFEDAGYKLVEANSFGAADAEFAKAAKEAGSNRAIQATEVWQQRENAMQAKIHAHNMWNPVPRLRVGM